VDGRDAARSAHHQTAPWNCREDSRSPQVQIDDLAQAPRWPLEQEQPMTWDQITGRWHQVKGQLRSKWGKLTDNDLETIGGKREALVGKLQERYGMMKDEAERQADDWMKTLH
jgi:uncharacterized protein YjbJ (UPF0337 family)